MARIPSQIGKYEVKRSLGSGGMADVYLARDPDLDRLVAIKVLRSPLLDDELIQRFLREARTAANLRHDNIVTIYEVGQHDDEPFIAMEHVDGVSLASVIRQRTPLELSVKLSYLEQVCAGLHHAHGCGVVHRDIKPANLMVDGRGVVRIVDFGIARVKDSGMTRDGDMIGTLAYMSPEQMLGRPIDNRSDVFSVGAVAYELLTYEPAFTGSWDELLRTLPYVDPKPLSAVCPDLPDALQRIVARALAKSPTDRFTDLEQVRIAVHHVRQTIDPRLVVEPPIDRTVVRPRLKQTPQPSGTAERAELLERRARQIALHKEAAQSALALGDVDAAIAACEDALTLDPDDSAALALRQQLSQTKSRRDQESRARHERERIGRQRLADAESKLSRGDVSGAAAVLGQLLATDPASSTALALLPRLREAARAAGIALPEALTARVPDVSHGQRSGVLRGGSAHVQQRKRAFIATGLAAAILAGGITVWFWMPAASPVSERGSADLVRGPIGEPVLPPPQPPSATAAGSGPESGGTRADTAIEAQLERINEAYRKGELDSALLLIRPVLGATRDERVPALARTIARTAQQSMMEAANAANRRNAADLAPRTMDAAHKSRALAEEAMRRNDFVEAGTQALLAAAAYTRSEREASLAASASVTPLVPPTPSPPVAAPEPAATPAPNTATIGPPVEVPSEKPIVLPAQPAPIAPAASAAPASPAPPSTPALAPSALDRERPGILQALSRYQNAYRERSVKALLNVYPTLPREAQQSLDRAFTRDCREYDVTFGNPQLALNADDPTYATITVRSTYTCQPRTRQSAVPSSLQELFVLRKLGDGWLIESAGTMDGRRLR